MALRVLLASAQVRGFNGTGGLGDVAAGLARALEARADISARLVMPAPRVLPEGVQPRLAIERLELGSGGHHAPVRVLACELPAFDPAESDPPVVCYLLEAPDPPRRDSPEEGLLLSLGTLALARRLDDYRVDVIHANDWHAGLVAACRDLGPERQGPDRGPAVVFTTHNLGPGFQGSFPDPGRIAYLAGIHLDRADPRSRWVASGGSFSFAGAGLALADRVNTVSPSYAADLRSPLFSGELAALVRDRGDLVGILNGLDLAEWDPADDPALEPFTYDRPDPIGRILERKRSARQLLRDWRGHDRDSSAYPFADLADSSALLASVGRIDHQKLPILEAALPELMRLESVQIALLGEPHPRDEFGQGVASRLQRAAADSEGRLLVVRGFDTGLSHRIYAAADIFLVPSLYEPCGLTQLIAMRYGAVPVVRATGGLADTVCDASISPDANGLSFREPHPDDTHADIGIAARLLVQTVRYALDLRRENPVRWAELVRNGMARDSSWSGPSAEYVSLYREAVAARGGT